MKLDAARLLVYRAATGAGAGFPSMYESAMAKCFANEMVAEVTSAAMQIFGGYGYSKEFPVERYLRDAKLCQIGGGTSEIQKRIIARELIRRT